MKDVNEIEQISKEEAEKLYLLTKEIVSKEQYIKDLKKVYKNISEGKPIIDLYDVFIKTNTDENGFPKLAIARADRKKIYLTKMGNFQHRQLSKNSWGSLRWSSQMDFSVPRNTFTNLIKMPENKRYSTKVPIIPVEHYPEEPLNKLFILWEVESWEEEEILPIDPLLLKRLTKNLFVIIAEWDLSPLEQAIMKGL